MAQLKDLLVTGSARFLNEIKGKLDWSNILNKPTLGTASEKDVPESGDASSTEVVMGNDSRLSDSRTPSSHTHGNIQNGGTLQTNDVAIASGDKLVVTDSSDSSKIARTSTSFDGSTTTKALTQKGTFETFLQSHQTIKQDGVVGATVNRFGTCSTGASTAAKTVSITTGTFSLEAGAMVTVKFTNANTANSPTLSVNSTTGKVIYVNGSQITSDDSKSLLKGTVTFIYDGSVWNLIGNYHDTTYTSESAASGGTDLSLVTTGEKYSWNAKSGSDINVKQTPMDGTFTSANYGILIAHTASNTETTEGAYKSTDLTYDPEWRTLRIDKGTHGTSDGGSMSEHTTDGIFSEFRKTLSSTVDLYATANAYVSGVSNAATGVVYLEGSHRTGTTLDYSNSLEMTSTDITLSGTQGVNTNNTWDGTNTSLKTDSKKVTQTATTTSANYDILFSDTADNTTRTEGVRKTSTFKYNPSTKSIQIGNLASNTTLGSYSIAVGDGNTASANYTAVFGYNNTVSAQRGFAEGYNNTISGGWGGHVEGGGNTVTADAGHAEGTGNIVHGYYAHAEGNGNQALAKAQHVFGEYNIADSDSGFWRGTYVEIVGNGTADDARSNARTLDWSGNEWLAGALTVGINSYPSSEGGNEYSYINTTKIESGVKGLDSQNNEYQLGIRLSAGSGDVELFGGYTGNTLTWDGTNTSLVSALAGKLSLSGGTMTGTLYTKNSNNKSVSFQSAASGNRGLYDDTGAKWMIHADSNNVVNLASGTVMDGGILLTRKNITVVNTSASKACTTSWAYVNMSYTVPAMSVSTVTVRATWTNSVPQAIGVSVSSTSGSGGNLVAINTKGANNDHLTTTATVVNNTSSAKTYYVWAQYGGNTNNTIQMMGFHIPYST